MIIETFMNLGNEMSDLMNEVNNQANEMSDLMNEVKNLAKRSYELIFYSNLSALSADRQATGRRQAGMRPLKYKLLFS